MKATKYFIRGLKLALVLLLGALIMLIPRLIAYTTLTVAPFLGTLLQIFCFLLGITVCGWLITKYRTWIFE